MNPQTFQKPPTDKRCFALVVDAIIIAAISLLISPFITNVIISIFEFEDYIEKHKYQLMFTYITSIAIAFAYFMTMEQSSWQTSAGKKLLEFKITTKDAVKPALKQTFIRNFLKVIILIWPFNPYFLALLRSSDAYSPIYIGYIFSLGILLLQAAYRSDGRSVFDLVGGTQVVKS